MADGNACWRCGAVQPETFADLVRAWRGERDLKETAEAVGVSAATISRIEAGQLMDMKSYALLVMAMAPERVSPDMAFDLLRRQLAAGANGATG